MKRFVLGCCLLALTGCVNVPEAARNSTLKITYLDGAECTGVALSPRSVLGAVHCEMAGGIPLTFNGRVIGVRGKMSDGNDHIIYWLDSPHGARPAVVSTVPLNLAETVYFVGCGCAQDKLLRVGHYSGLHDLPRAPRPSPGVHQANLFLFAVCSGDSGGPVFDRMGRVVGIISIGSAPAELSIAGAFPFAFTPEQWRMAQQP